MANGLRKKVKAKVKLPASLSVMRASCLHFVAIYCSPNEGIWKTKAARQETSQALSLASGWPGHGLCPL